SGADPAALAVVVVGADQARQQVVQLRWLDLEAAFPRPSVLGEYVEDQLRPVDNAKPELALQVALLPRAQVLVADQDVVPDSAPGLPQLLHLALPDEERRIHLRAALDAAGDDFRAGGPAQLGQLGHLLGERAGRGARELDSDQVGALLRRLGRDQLLS